MGKAPPPDWTPRIERFENDIDWLKARRKAITASDSRGILSQGYSNECPMSVYADKIAEDEPEPITDNDSLIIGTLMEKVCIELFEMKRGVKPKVDRGKVLRYSKVWPWMAATLDAYYYLDGKIVPVEFKNVGGYNASEWDGDEAPLKVEIQVQHQLAVCNADFGWVFAIQGGNEILMKRIVANKPFQEGLIRKLLEFKARVDRRIPPPVDWTGACEQALIKLNPKDVKECVILPLEAQKLADEMRELAKYEKLAKNAISMRKAVLKALMGPAAFAILPDNTGFSFKTQDKKAKPACEHCGAKGSDASSTRVFRNTKKIPDNVPRIEYKPLPGHEPGFDLPDKIANPATDETKKIDADEQPKIEDHSKTAVAPQSQLPKENKLEVSPPNSDLPECPF